MFEMSSKNLQGVSGAWACGKTLKSGNMTTELLNISDKSGDFASMGIDKAIAMLYLYL